MKASIKFRDEQKPLFRAKIPLNIIGFPFQWGIVAGESKELSLNLSTFFESGPSLKIAYRPNDSINPFSLVFKTGIGHFGSPISSSMNMSADFSLLGGRQLGQNPRFFVHFKPRFGDFTVKKTQSSVFNKRIDGGYGVNLSDKDSPVIIDVLDNCKTMNFPLTSPAAGVVRGVLSDVELTATTAVPLRKSANLNFRWGVRFPVINETETATVLMKKKNDNKSTAAISFQKQPILIINKIGIEHVYGSDCKVASNEVGPMANDVAETFLVVKKQMEIIQAENGALRKAMDNLKNEFSAVKTGSNAVRFNSGTKGNKELNAYFGGKGMVGEIVNDIHE